MGDEWGLALALTNLGRIEATWGSTTSPPVPPLEEATTLFRSLRDDWLALPLTSLGAIAFRAGTTRRRGPRLQRRCLASVRSKIGATRPRCSPTSAYVALASGEVEEARAIFAESLAFGREHGDRFNTPACLRGFGAGRLPPGTPSAPSASSPPPTTCCRDRRDAVARRTARRAYDPLEEFRAELGEAAFSAAWEAGRRLLEEATIEAVGEVYRAAVRDPSP